MNEISKHESDEPQQESSPEVKPQPEAKMLEDFVDPEGKKGKWGEVVENKELGVRYREKIIELPKHRQKETGIKKIRRRELLPPFQEDFCGRSTDGAVYFSNDRKFDNEYKFLTDGIYPSMRTLVHVFDWNFATVNISHYQERTNKDIQRLKREGIYFQEIYGQDIEAETKNEQIPFRDKELSLSLGPYHGTKFITPMFIFGNRNKAFMNYLEAINKKERFQECFSGKYDEKNYRGTELILSIKNNPSIKPLRWCHAELALVPTKRSLNVLFFETGDEDKEDKELN